MTTAGPMSGAPVGIRGGSDRRRRARFTSYWLCGLAPQNRRDNSARPVDSRHENLADVGGFARTGVESEGCRKVLPTRL